MKKKDMFEKSEGFTLRTFAFCYLDIAFWFILEWNVYLKLGILC